MPVEITSPIGNSVHVNNGESFTLRCRGDMTAELQWFVDDVLISLLPGKFEISVDVTSGNKISLLTKDNVQPRDTGTYTCKDYNIEDAGDSILVMVAGNGGY